VFFNSLIGCVCRRDPLISDGDKAELWTFSFVRFQKRPSSHLSAARAALNKGKMKMIISRRHQWPTEMSRSLAAEEVCSRRQKA
jgi:hypothetical protein